MAVEVVSPARRIGRWQHSGKLNRWLVAEGARVREGQPLFEIETDQVTEIEAPASGVLRGLRAKPGDRVCRPARRSPGSSAKTSRSTPICRRSPASCGRCSRRSRRRRPATRRLSSMTPTNARLPCRPRRRWRSARARGSIACGSRAARGRRWCSFTASARTSTDGGLWSAVCRPPYSALALDLPGHGASPFAGETSLAALTAAVAAALAEEGVRAAHLVGHSLGGAIAAALTAAPGLSRASLALLFARPASARRSTARSSPAFCARAQRRA